MTRHPRCSFDARAVRVEDLLRTVQLQEIIAEKSDRSNFLPPHRGALLIAQLLSVQILAR